MAMREDTIGLEFASAVEVALEAGQPVAEECSAIIDRLHPLRLKGWLRHLGVRDQLMIRIPQFSKLQDRARRFTPSGFLSLERAFEQKKRGRPARPSVMSVLSMLRIQNEFLFSQLAPFPKARVRHMVEVGICPMSIREAMTSLVGLSFTTSATSTHLNSDFVPAKDVFAQAVGMGRSRDNRVIPFLREFESLYLCSEDDHGYSVAMPSCGVLYDFEYDLSSGGCGLPAGKAATIENGNAIHRAMEEAALSSRPLPPQFVMPEGYIPGDADEPPFDWHPGWAIPPGLVHELEKRLSLWWENGGHDEPCRSSDATFADPNRWVEEFNRLDMRSRLPAPMPVEEVMRVLSQSESSGNPLLVDVLMAVFLSCVRVGDRRSFFPISLFPVHDASPVVKKRRDIHVRFGPEFFGRETYDNLTRADDKAAAAVQVVRLEP